MFFNYLIVNKLNLLKKQLKMYIVKFENWKGETKIAYFLKSESEMSQLKIGNLNCDFFKK